MPKAVPKKKSPAAKPKAAPAPAANPVPAAEPLAPPPPAAPCIPPPPPDPAPDPNFIVAPPSPLETAALRFADQARTGLGRFAWFLLASRERQRAGLSTLWVGARDPKSPSDYMLSAISMAFEYSREDADRRARERHAVREDDFKRQALAAEQQHAMAMARLRAEEERRRFDAELRARDIENQRREADERARNPPPVS